MKTNEKSSVTEGQIKQFLSLFEGVVRRLAASRGITKEAMQSAIEKGGEFVKKLESMINEFLSYEEYLQTIKNAGYCSYGKPKEIVEQLETICSSFRPKILEILEGMNVKIDKNLFHKVFLVVSSVLSNYKSKDEMRGGVFENLPKKAEGLFAFIRWEDVASQYGKAVQIMMRLIELQRDCKFHNYLGYNKDKDFEFLIQCDESIEAWNKIYKDQEDNLLIIPAQFGLCYKNICNSRLPYFVDKNEFGLGIFHALVMILTHPERFSSEGDLWIFCPGDKYMEGSNNVVGISYISKNGNFSLESFREDVSTTCHGQMTGWFVQE